MTALALLLPLAIQAAQPAPYPSKHVLTAFGEVCRPLEDMTQAEALAVKAGWQKFTPDPASPIGELLAFGRSEGEKMLEKEGGGSMTPSSVLRRTVAGEDLVVIFTGVRMNGVSVNGCRMYDVGETRGIDAAAAQAWVGRAPDTAVAEDNLNLSSWEPGFAPKHQSLEIFFVPPGSPLIEFTKVSGIALTADLVGVDR